MFSTRNLLTAVIMGGLLPAAFSQTSQPLSLIWKVDAEDTASSYLKPTGNATRGMYLNTNVVSGGSLLVASRENGIAVRRIDPATGVLLIPETIPNTYVATATTFAINKVVVNDDGIIYVMSLGTAGTANEQHFRIFRHANESTPETLAYDVRTDNFTGNGGPGIAARLGDDADITGTGNNTKILVAGASGGGVSLFTTTDNGMTFTRTALVGTPAFPTATPHIAWDPTTPNRFFYRGTGGEAARAYDITEGTDVATGASGPGNELPSLAAAPLYGPIDIGPVLGVNSLALGIGNSAAGETNKLLLVYRLSDLQIDYFGENSQFTGGANLNGNGAGDIYIDSVNNAIYSLYTNNALTKYQVPPASVGDWSLYQPAN